MMKKEKIFAKCAVTPEHPDYSIFISRRSPLYEREGDIRTPFIRDYTRILHSLAYRRLKHKTQVFYNVENDHICTRMEHVTHVESVSETIAVQLGLSRDLTRAIAAAHDIGHAPFGHQGERVINQLSQEVLNKRFWHEQNGLHFVDDIELLEDDQEIYRPLNLTYAVRDGIISHCGEVDENGIFPRKECIDLALFDRPGKYQPSTWEGCVVKISDKIAYLGRDIEDAIRLGILSESDKKNLCDIVESPMLNTTVLMNRFVSDICENSSPEEGILLSSKSLRMMDEVKSFNYWNIYASPELAPFGKYSELVIRQLFEMLHSAYDGENTLDRLRHGSRRGHEFRVSFAHWLTRFCDIEEHPQYATQSIFGRLEEPEIYDQAILDYLSGMTDGYAIKAFHELITF